jgi:hypothetical protein
MASNYHESDLMGEPTLDEMLADPIVQLIMHRDGLEAQDMRGTLDRIQMQYAAQRVALQ